MEKIYLIGFGNNQYYESLTSYNINKIHKKIDCIPILYTKSDLPKSMVDFCEKNRQTYGYGVWKPYIVEKTFNLMNDEDVLMYIDGRTYYTGKEIDYIYELLGNKNLDAIFWKMEGLFEYQYTKEDFFQLLNATDNNIRNSGQIASTFFFIKKNIRTVPIIKKWNSFMNSNRNLFIDGVANNPNSVNFIESRREQSILSLLVKSFSGLKMKFISSKEVASGPLKPHSLPHENEFPKIINKLPKSFIRIIFMLKRVSVSKLFKEILNRFSIQK